MKLNTPIGSYARGRLIVSTLVLLVLLSTIGLTQNPTLSVLGNFQPREGDVIFQSLPRAPLVNAIEGSTGSPFSHCGIVARKDGRWVVYEALTRVGDVPLSSFVLRGRQQKFAIYRLKEPHQRHVEKTLQEVKKMIGRPYDVRYRLDDEKIYCSELIYKAYLAATGESLGRLARFRDLRWQPYQRLIESIENGPVPLDRKMITPRGLANASQFQRVLNHGYGP